MNTFFIFVSPNGSDPIISERINSFYYSLLYKKSRDWNIEFIFLPRIFDELGSEAFFDTFPLFRGLSINEIYEKLINAFSDVVSIESPGILVIKDDEAPVFEPLDTQNLYKTLLFLPNKYGIVRWDADPSYYGGGRNDREWYRFRRHAAPNTDEPGVIMEANVANSAKIAEIRERFNKDFDEETLEAFKKLYHKVAPYIDRLSTLGEVLEIEDNLSNIKYSFKNCTFKFCEYDGKSIELSPEHATLFLFFLEHKNGINTSSLKDYKEELLELYKKFTFYQKHRVYTTDINKFELPDDKFVCNLISDVDTNRSNYMTRFKDSITKKLDGIDKKTINQYIIVNIPDDEIKTYGRCSKYIIPAASKITIEEEMP